jgi:alpha-D-ribose 1-methylphosphonate 5-triphosphate diphosphatase PhnM
MAARSLAFCPICNEWIPGLERHLGRVHRKFFKSSEELKRFIEKRQAQPGKLARGDIDRIEQESRQTAVEVARHGLSRAVQGGLPGLGKRH